MYLNEVEPKTGFAWFRDGVALFRRNPLAFLMIFIAYWFALMAVSLVPYLGGILPLLFVPGIAVGFMSASRDALADKPINPTILVDGFRGYGRIVARRLLILGLLYVIAIALIFAISALADGGTLVRLMLIGGEFDEATLTSGNLAIGFLVAMLCYVPVSMIFWFAPVLVAWHDVTPHKSLFFSLVACWRNRGAFTVYGIVWGALGFAVSIVLSVLLQALGLGPAALILLMPASVVLGAMLYCSFYATYLSCFRFETASEIVA
jgi:hypothetical protein